MAAAQQVSRYSRTDALRLFYHFEWKSADKWNNEKLGLKLSSIKDVLDDENGHSDDPATAALLVDLQADFERGSTFEVFDAEESETKVKPAQAEKTETKEVKEEAKEETTETETQKKRRQKKTEAVEAPKVEEKTKTAEPDSEEDDSISEDEIDDVDEEIDEPVKQSRTTVKVLDDVDADGVLKILGDKNANNTTNRKMQTALLKRYSGNMLTGRWDYGLRAHVIIDTHGKIQNCQHVLNAFVAASRAYEKDPSKYPAIKRPMRIDLIVESGIEPTSANFIDTGRGRTHADIFYRLHEFVGNYKAAEEQKLAKWKATAARILYNRLSLGKKVRSPEKFEHADLLDVNDMNPDLTKSVEFIYKLDQDKDHEKCIKILNVAHPYLIAAHYLAAAGSYDNDELQKESEANEFFQKLAFGTETNTESPVYVLREWLLRQKGSRSNEALNRIYDALVIAWNADQKGEEITAQQLSKAKANAWVQMGGLDSRPE